ncbi:hypothetical protein MHU86_15086 [Fragilaria crotonensis]|nr:hypothetical protein MHU86_15086 [Fragilaria crotonensis]
MGVRPGTVDGRVPQQTPRRTPRTLSESAARDSPAGTHAHEPSRPATSPTPRISPARDDPSRNEVGPERYAPASTRHRPTTRGARIVARRRPRRADISPRRHATPASRSASPKGPSSASRDLDSDRLADVRANLARGNHKSARGHEAKLISMLKDEAQGLAATTAARSRLRDQGMRGRASGDGRADVDRRKEIQ